MHLSPRTVLVLWSKCNVTIKYMEKIQNYLIFYVLTWWILTYSISSIFFFLLISNDPKLSVFQFCILCMQFMWNQGFFLNHYGGLMSFYKIIKVLIFMTFQMLSIYSDRHDAWWTSVLFIWFILNLFQFS